MCITPSEISVLRGPTWEKVPVPCGSCWRCKANRVNDFVGRSLCEAHTSDWTVSITLTYRPRDDLADKILTPKHFQNFIRSMRKTGHKVRYLAIGEYGTLRGRAHFHCIMFGMGQKIEIPHKTKTHIDQWPHGHVFADWDTDEKSIRYTCKYLLGNKNKGNYWFTLSKKPPLGAAFFQQKAAENVKHSVLPSTFEYLPPNGDKGRPYMMSRATRRDYLAAIFRGWAEKKNPVDHARLSEWVKKVVDKEDFNAAVKKAEEYEKLNAKQAFETFKAEIQERQHRGRSATSYQLEVDRDIHGMSDHEYRHFMQSIKEHFNGTQNPTPDPRGKTDTGHG